MIEVYWSPQFCKIVKQTNLHHIDDEKVSIGKQMCTFDGSLKYSKTGIVYTDMQKPCARAR